MPFSWISLAPIQVIDLQLPLACFNEEFAQD